MQFWKNCSDTSLTAVLSGRVEQSHAAGAEEQAHVEGLRSRPMWRVQGSAIHLYSLDGLRFHHRHTKRCQTGMNNQINQQMSSNQGNSEPLIHIYHLSFLNSFIVLSHTFSLKANMAYNSNKQWINQTKVKWTQCFSLEMHKLFNLWGLHILYFYLKYIFTYYTNSWIVTLAPCMSENWF